jgi:thiol-disulfide isomerase/thioredoxin
LLGARSLRDGAPFLVHFFTIWCEPCREELTAPHRLAERAREIIGNDH